MREQRTKTQSRSLKGGLRPAKATQIQKSSLSLRRVDRALSTTNGAIQSTTHLLQLQRQYGNNYVQRVLASSRSTPSGTSDIEQTIEQSRGNGHPLQSPVRTQMESAFGVNFSGVRVHTDLTADRLSQALNARAFTTGTDVFFRQGEYSPESVSGRQLLAHELTHVVQQTGGIPGRTTVQRKPTVPATSLGAVPAVERREMQSSTLPVPSTLNSELTSLFATNPALAGGATAAYLVSATVSFSANIPITGSVVGYDLHRGLRSVGGWLMGQTTPNILPLNATVALELDLTAFGGDRAIYRFSYYDVGTGDSSVEHLLIENVATVPAAPTPQPVPAGTTFQVGGRNFRLGSGWSQTEFTLLHQALGLLSSSALQQIENVEFQRSAALAGNPEAGNYDSNANTITIRTNAFNTSLARFGTSPDSIRIILHEIGHALDYAILNRAWSRYSSSGNAQPLLGARSLSGLVYQLDASGNFAIVAGSQATAYRQAVERDRAQAGGRSMPTSITTYGATSWEENFAEAYSLFVSDPATFRELRPNTYAYFTRQFP